jgi:hypothetical protein
MLDVRCRGKAGKPISPDILRSWWLIARAQRGTEPGIGELHAVDAEAVSECYRQEGLEINWDD